MDKTQILSIELGSECNLGCLHQACPNRSPERYAHVDSEWPLEDDAIVRLVSEFYARGFAGLVAWHYYNEPLIQIERMFGLMDWIAEKTPKARFLLWTNGTLIPSDCRRFAAFEQCHVTHYGGDNAPRNLAALRASCPRVHVHHNGFDRRLIGLSNESDSSCLRPFTEFVIDYHGNVHLCCYDWRGLASPGNVLTQPLDEVLARWVEIRATVVGERMTRKAPEACRRCQMRTAAFSGFDTVARRRAEQWRKERVAC